jgi:polysaccharide export outer membrane protein
MGKLTGKERILRFPRISRLVGSTSAMLVVLALVGCDGLTPKSFDPNKGFIDPSEVAVIRDGKQPLLVPILDKLDPSVEEDDMTFGNATEVRAEDLVPTQGDYRIGKSDLLQITITDLVGPGIESLKQSRVSESGRISLPLIGQVDADSLTEAQLETLIAQKYRDANIISNAQVSVVVVEARARTFSIIGSVQQAGQYAILKNDFRLLDALVLARDLTVDTDIRGNRGIEYAYILRKVSRDEEVTGQSAAPATAPVNPTNPDVLAPQSNAHKLGVGNAVFMAEDPATAPTAGTQPEGRYVIVDGKPVLVGSEGQPATAPADAAMTPAPLAPAAEATPPAPEATPAPVLEPAAPATQGFAFNEIKPVTDQRIIKVPLAKLKEGDLRYNIVIRPDDTVVVRPPVQGEYYMGGHVNRVGVYSLTARKITLTQAVISAGMLDAIAIPGRTEIRRRIGTDQVMICRVDLEKIFAGQQADIFLKPEDQVIVGTNALSPFIAALRGGFRVTYGFGFLYDRNYAPNNNNN